MPNFNPNDFVANPPLQKPYARHLFYHFILQVLPEEQEEFENLAQNPSCHRRRGTHPSFKKNSQNIQNKP